MKLPIGKVPSSILKKIVFPRKGFERDDVIIGPGVGIDSAILKNSGKYIIATTDPITATSKLIGQLSIYIITNDLIVSGALPKWYLSTILLPKNTTEKMLETIVNEMDENAKKIKMEIVGGHSEVTPYLNFPIIIGTAIGTANKFYSASRAKPGDLILMTKRVGIEGIAIIANEYPQKLQENGFSNSEIIKLQKMIDETTIYQEGKIIINDFGEYVHAMHDPTEGGIFTALHEIADASNTGIEIYFEKIPVDKETQKICDVLKINPYLLLSSGSLLIASEDKEVDELIKSLKKSKIQVNIIGRVLKDFSKRILIRNGRKVKLPRQEKDEIWKLFK